MPKRLVVQQGELGTEKVVCPCSARGIRRREGCVPMELVVQQGGLRYKEVCAPKEKSNSACIT